MASEKRKAATAALEQAQEKGYFGHTPDPHPNSAYSLESGPSSPPIVKDNRSLAEYLAVRKEKADG